MTRLVVFDLDGTLVDSAAQIVDAMREGYAAVGRRTPVPASVLALVGISLPLMVERLSPELPASERDRVVEAYRRAFLSSPVRPPLYRGARATLGQLSRRAGVALAVATGKSVPGLRKILDQHALGGFFGSVHGGDEHPSKPDPAMLRAAIAAAGVDATGTVMVGDSVYDMEMARSAAVPAIGVSWGYGSAVSLRRAGAAAIAADFRSLPALLDQAAGRAA